MSRKCPKCKRVWDDDARFCGNCGEELETRSRARRRFEEQQDISPALVWVMDLCPGAFKPVVLAFSLLGIALALVAFWLAVFFLQLGGAISAFAIGGGGMVVYWTSLSWLLYGYIVVPVEAMAEFQGKHWMALVLATTVPASVFLLLVKLATKQ